MGSGTAAATALGMTLFTPHFPEGDHIRDGISDKLVLSQARGKSA